MADIVDYSEEIIRDGFRRSMQAIAQPSVSAADKTIFVWAAGNAGSYADQGVDFSSPEVFPGMTYFIEEIHEFKKFSIKVNRSFLLSSWPSLIVNVKE